MERVNASVHIINQYELTVCAVFAKAYTSMALVCTKDAGSQSYKSSSGALNIHPDGMGMASLFIALDTQAFRPTSLSNAIPSSAIMMLVWKWWKVSRTDSTRKTDRHTGTMFPWIMPREWRYSTALATCCTWVGRCGYSQATTMTESN